MLLLVVDAAGQWLLGQTCNTVISRDPLDGAGGLAPHANRQCCCDQQYVAGRQLPWQTRNTVISG